LHLQNPAVTDLSAVAPCLLTNPRENFSEEEVKMAGSASMATPAKLHAVQDTEPTRSSPLLQNSILTELPGAAFAAITLVYVVSSLATL
jgi:hypothetical protein